LDPEVSSPPLSLSSPPPPLSSSLRAPFFSPARNPARPLARATLRAAPHCPPGTAARPFPSPSRGGVAPLWPPRAAAWPSPVPLARRATPPQPPGVVARPPPWPPARRAAPSRSPAPRARLPSAPTRGPSALACGLVPLRGPRRADPAPGQRGPRHGPCQARGPWPLAARPLAARLAHSRARSPSARGDRIST
jgi:hypothetical protein